MLKKTEITWKDLRPGERFRCIDWVERTYIAEVLSFNKYGFHIRLDDGDEAFAEYRYLDRCKLYRLDSTQVDTRPCWVEPEYGVTCTKCNSHYVHAERVSGFICWGCRNGY